ncbi:NAD(P)-dependent oxidoreductase [Paenibacillus thalictri]|uniref:NAD(P)-dependent oxidoreductase n=1 Tax=Paenibacillus thalictri TaxID=2527873 RepID=A0A4Q9DF88_9BACL|nr:NAD(P)-dependent oxidoreductase [Paenibacillus thalictri]TBL70506.1 NAD(P)-dependent oxidoreductase [Paenibacillus thalictri]
MKIAVIGANGKAGSSILKEAADRGHEVTAIVRNASKLQSTGTAVIEKDVFSLTASDLAPFDVVINAFGAPLEQEQLHVKAGHALIEALKGTPTRLIVVGGAGSLFVDEAETVRVVDTPDFPKEYHATASNQAINLEELRNSTSINWTFVSPSAFFDPQGPRTGTYRKGKNQLLINSKGQSYVSYADYAIAIVDEIENPQHLNERFTVVSEN